ncbi:MAG: polysaccharide biosynthesis C-terminal domain-containing protein [Chitinophagaceae bacterium]
MKFKKALSHTILLKTINTICNFAINLLIVRLLGVADSGHFFYTISILALVNLLIGLCIENGITYYANKYPGQIKKISIAVFFLLIIQSLLSWLVFSVLPISFPIGIATLFVVGYMAINYFTAIFTAQKKYIAVNLIPVIVNLVFVSWLCYCLFNTSAGSAFTQVHFIEIYIASILLQAILLILHFFVFPSVTLQNSLWHPGLGVKILKFSLMVFLGNLIYFLVLRIDYYFTEKYCDAIAFSNYIQVSKIGQMLLLLPSMAATVIFPYTASEESHFMLAATLRSLRIFLTIYILIALALIAGGYWIFPFLFGNAFGKMYLPLLLLLPGILFLTVMTVLSAYLDGIKKLWYPIVGNLIALISIAILDYLFIPVWGIYAAATISSIGYFLCTAFTCFWFFKFSGADLKDIFKLNLADFSFIRNT